MYKIKLLNKILIRCWYLTEEKQVVEHLLFHDITIYLNVAVLICCHSDNHLVVVGLCKWPIFKKFIEYCWQSAICAIDFCWNYDGKKIQDECCPENRKRLCNYKGNLWSAKFSAVFVSVYVVSRLWINLLNNEQYG